MPLVTLKSVLDAARDGGYAVGAFNFYGIEDLRGILDAALEKRSPVIAMASCNAVEYIGVEGLCGYLRGLCQSIDVPVVLHLDHAKDISLIKRCIDGGFTSVMVDASAKPIDENVAVTRSVVKYACQFGVSVEAELGRVGGKEDDIKTAARDAFFTDPDDVVPFVRATGIDALAIAIGTVHGFYKEEPKLDFERLSKIRSLTDIPLVLHGGSGVPEDDFVRSIKLGMTKINVGTELKNFCCQSARRGCAEFADTIDVRKLLSYNRPGCRDIAAHKMELFGCANRA